MSVTTEIMHAKAARARRRETTPIPQAVPDEAYRVWERDGWTLAMGAIPTGNDECPPEEGLRGDCPDCGNDLVANLYWHEKHGYLLRYECWQGLMPGGTCRYYFVP